MPLLRTAKLLLQGRRAAVAEDFCSIPALSWAAAGRHASTSTSSESCSRAGSSLVLTPPTTHSAGSHHVTSCSCEACRPAITSPWQHQHRQRHHQSPSFSVRHFASNSKGVDEGKEQPPNGQAGPAKEGDEQGQEEAAEPASVEDLTAELQAARDDNAALAAQVDKLTDQLKRALAEMENVRSRAARDVDAAKKFAMQGFVKGILDVGDNLERAAASVPPDALSEDAALDAAALRKLLKGLLEGVSATEKILLHAFKMNGVEMYSPLGEKFDPNLHNALFEVPDASKEPGVVAAVTKRGYTLHGRVVRPADVGVARVP